MTEIATIVWFGRWGTSVFSENTAIFLKPNWGIKPFGDLNKRNESKVNSYDHDDESSYKYINGQTKMSHSTTKSTQ